MRGSLIRPPMIVRRIRTYAVGHEALNYPRSQSFAPVTLRPPERAGLPSALATVEVPNDPDGSVGQTADANASCSAPPNRMIQGRGHRGQDQPDRLRHSVWRR